MTKKTPKIYPVGKAIKELNIARVTLYNYIKAGVIPDRRNPHNNYHVVYEEDIEKIRECLMGKVKK